MNSKPFSSIHFFTGLAFISIMGCSESPDIATSDSQTPVLAQVNQTNSITHSDLPMADQIKLFNSEFQLHQLTLASLRETIEKQHQPADSLSLDLLPPNAPTIQINVQPSWQQTFNEHLSSQQSLKLDVLCSYASRPCSDIMSAVDELAQHAGTQINVKYYDFWQPYHRHAQQAAAAVHCSQGEAAQQLQQALWLRQGNMDMEHLTSNVDIYNHQSNKADDIYKCMQSSKTHDFLTNNHKQLQSLGFRQTPTVLINGQYISRGHEVGQLFNALYPKMHLAIEQGDRSITWIQSWLEQSQSSPINTRNWAIVEHNGQVLRLDKGAKIGDLYLAQVEKDGVIFYENGRLLTFAQHPIEPAIAPTLTTQSNTVSDYESPTTENQHQDEIQDEENLSHKERYEKVLAKIKPQSLPQSWLEEQLMRQSELEDSLFHTEGQIEGKSLVKLDKENIDDFYSSLGMMPGDVIMRVNDDWIHEDNNTLFQSLANEENVTISVMRKGLPVHLAFEVVQ